MYLIFSAIAPVFFLIFAGMAIERLNFLPENTSQVLGVFVVNVCMPCLLLHVMASVTSEQLSRTSWWMAVIGVQMAVFCIFFLAEKLRHAPTGPAVISGLSASFCNAAFVGLPVIISLFPDNQEALIVAGLGLISTNAVAILGQVILDAWHKKGSSPSVSRSGSLLPLRILHGLRRYLLGNPVLMATVLGLLLSLSQTPLWKPLDKALSTLGYTAPACMLFSLGLGLRGHMLRALRGQKHLFGHSTLLVLCKLTLLPALTWATLAFAGYGGLWLSVMVIMSATGTAVVTAVFAEIYQASPEESALCVTVSNLLSLFSLMGFAWLLQQSGQML